MVKYFSVDWLAQSHRSVAQSEGPVPAPTCKPHILCMEQPRPPTFGKGYVQTKPKTYTSESTAPVESSAHQDARPCVLVRPTTCAGNQLVSVSESGGYSSGYESEAASSECPSVDEGSEGETEKDAPQRRTRTKFTPGQISKLEKVFSKHRYLNARERVKTAQKLNLTETQVRTWFQNRRMKLKRELQDYHVPPLMFRSLPPVRYHSMGAQPPHFPVNDPGFYPLPMPPTTLPRRIRAHHPPRLIIYNQSFY